MSASCGSEVDATEHIRDNVAEGADCAENRRDGGQRRAASLTNVAIAKYETASAASAISET